jgi:hypothetical protein
LSLAIVGVVFAIGRANGADADSRYILLNLAASEIHNEGFQRIKQLAEVSAPGHPRLGVGAIISYLRDPPAETRRRLQDLLALCKKYELPVIVQLDGEQWWMNRPDLWNWWDKTKPGFDPANAANVEWSGWGPEHALKIAWRNWSRQWRVLPPPNLMSPRYRAACHEEMEPLVKDIVRWRDELPADKRWLLVGVKVGWESAIGMGSHYYPNGNALLDKNSADDPDWDTKPEILPGRGFQPIGYAAVSTAGLATSGELKEEHLAEAVRRHLDDLCVVAQSAGLTREQIFTHSGGWKEGELLYRSAVNEHSCPGWSFYHYARDPKTDKTAMAAVADSNAPYWAAAEWLPVGARTSDQWHAAIRNTLSVDRCRYVCIYNWRQLKSNAIAIEGIRRALADTLAPGK